MTARCRICGQEKLLPVLDLGEMPLANALLAEPELDRPEPRYPLSLVFCAACALLQIRETIPPEKLFRDYPYHSSFSETMLAHARAEAEMLTERLRLSSRSFVVEAASNDGYLLQNFVEKGIPVLGIEPAENIARIAGEKGIPTQADFFGLETARRIRKERGPADLFLANNVLAHATDLHDFVSGMAHLLHEKGTAVLEFPYARDLVERTAFDTIYHEHLCYFSLHPLQRLFAPHDLEITGADRIEIHGGSLRLFVAHASSAGRAPEAVQRMLREEKERGMTGIDFYRPFARRVDRLKSTLRAELENRKKKGNRIAGYGASAKGTILLNLLGVGRETIDFVVDRNPLKQGRFTPGTRLPILPPGALLERRPDTVLLLTWNFADEILDQQSDYIKKGGEFLIPIPEVRSVTQERLP
jgi:hypothetical protein